MQALPQWGQRKYLQGSLTRHFCSVLFSHSVVSDSLQPYELQHSRPPCPSPTPGVYSNLCPLSQWCHPTISSSVVPFSSCPQSFPASGSFPVSQLFVSGGQSIGASASASVLPMNIQGWFHLGLNSLISLLSEELSRVFSSTTIWKYQFFGFSLLYHVHIIHKTNLCNLMTFSNWTELCPVVSINTVQC